MFSCFSLPLKTGCSGPSHKVLAGHPRQGAVWSWEKGAQKLSGLGSSAGSTALDLGEVTVFPCTKIETLIILDPTVKD